MEKIVSPMKSTSLLGLSDAHAGDTELRAPLDLPQPAMIPGENPLLNVHVEQVVISPASRLVILSDPRSPNADRIRYLRMHLRSFWKAGRLKTLVVTSAQPKDGKSTISLNLAAALSEQGKHSVLLVETDLHQPALAQNLKLRPRPGVAEILEDGRDPFSLITRLEPLQIHLLQAGTPRRNASDLVQSDAFAKLVESLKPHFDWILFDTPPVEVLTDPLAIARLTDGVLFVVRADETPKKAVERAIEQIGPRRIVGLVLNAADGLDQLYSKYGRYYGDRR